MSDAPIGICESCRWWVREGKQAAGDCRRYPPTVNPLKTSTPGTGTKERMWVWTLADEWCGEYARKS